MRRGSFIVFVALVVVLCSAGSAGAHSAFLGATPEPGARLGSSPASVRLVFTEPLNDRLSKASIVAVSSGKQLAVRNSVSGKRLTVTLPAQALMRGAYRVQWHTVSTEDGHALEGTFSFGVRAAAVGGEHDVQQSPFARNGWLRVLARVILYAALLVFCGAVLLEALLHRRGLPSWLTPPALADTSEGLDLQRVAGRHRSVALNFGFAAIGAAALSAAADAADAADGFSPQGLSDFLLHASAGLTRLYVVGFLAVALVMLATRTRLAAIPALAALLALAMSGHANASSPRTLAVINDWLHLSSTSLWLGGITVLVLAWGPSLRAAGRTQRLAVARHVLPVFGRVALPAFVVVVLTGVVSAVIELGSIAALWQSDYGRVLLIKSDLVAFIATASYIHARRLRPRLLDPNRSTPDRLERRHWRLLGVEPLLGVGVVAAVAVLVAFPLPPRQLSSVDEAQAATGPACAPCPLPTPAHDELAVAEQAGSNVVAAWIRKEGTGLAGTVRVYALSKRPRRGPFTIVGATQNSCGDGCQRFRLATGSRLVTVALRDRGHRYVARLPAQWQSGANRRARLLMLQAQGTMRELRSVREVEKVTSVPGLQATTTYVLGAPNRMTFQTDLGVHSVVIGGTQWIREPDFGYRRTQFGGGLPFRTHTWFTWSTFAQYTYLLREQREDGRPVAVVALMDPGTPAWWQLHIDLRTHRVLHDRLVTYSHFSTQQFSHANQPVSIDPPSSVSANGP
ncbi:CopD family protein [Paraconexibacter antarcticus]|uniref:CopD family protein n=1 Tax=Paraconexibacter antarcticus TaxID=2949664 RepID=A0ABY5E1M9_9ACTN|nr:CopD family protein [Paraconexibacter antarcticus]UTI67109.1 CopD family protein [Paraconexibacter antarcticus]